MLTFRPLSRLTLILPVLVFLSWTINLQAEPLRVGVYGSAPFVQSMSTQNKIGKKTTENWRGISLDLWREIARRESLDYTLKQLASIDQGLQLLEADQLDILVGPISVTRNRATIADFTHPYYEANSGILSRRKSIAPLGIIRQFMRTGLPIALGLLLITLFIVGLLFWLLEHKKNERLSDQFIYGLGASMWFAMVTFVTVGYGDITPRTVFGRILTGSWMLMSMLIASSITAVMATAFTLQGIKTAAVESITDLRHRPVAVVKGTTGATFAGQNGAIPIETNQLADAVAYLQKGKVAAVTHDYPIIRYYLQQNPDANLQLIESNAQSESYAFAMRKGHPARHKINLAILGIMESGELKQIMTTGGLE